MSSDVSIIALGARTPVGLTAASAAAAVRAGISRVGDHPSMIDPVGEPLRCGRDARIDSALANPMRMTEMAVATLREVTAALAQHPSQSGPWPLFLALPETRPGFGREETHSVSGAIQSAALPRGAIVRLEPVAGGRAGGLRALELAVAAIRERRTELALVGGVDSYLQADTLDWLEADQRLARAGRRGGFHPGEAAAMIAIATPSTASLLGLRPLGYVRMVATAIEPRSPASEEGLLGEVLSEVIRRVTQSLHLPEECIDDIYCDINGERCGTDDWAFAVLRVPTVFRDGTRYTTAVRCCGDVGAASGALNCVLAVSAWERRYALGRRALVWGTSFEGLRGAAVLEREGS